MDSIKSLPTMQRLFVVCCVVLGAILLSSATLSSSGRLNQKEISLPILKDNTASFNLISQERLDRRYVTRIQNASKKVITAYVTAVCDVPYSATDYTIGDYPVQPGDVVELSIPIGALPDKCRAAMTQPTIAILAVVFDDQTYGGEFIWAKGILDQRLGKKIQLERINSLLTQALKWSDIGEPVALKRLKDKIISLPINEGENSAVQAGLSEAKQRALYLLEEIEQWHQRSLTSQSTRNIPIRAELTGIDSIPRGLNKFITINEKWISRY